MKFWKLNYSQTFRIRLYQNCFTCAHEEVPIKGTKRCVMFYFIEMFPTYWPVNLFIDYIKVK